MKNKIIIGLKMRLLKKYNAGSLIFTVGIVFILFSGCTVQKTNIKVPLSQPIPHPMLLKMQSIPITVKSDESHFGNSKKYIRNGLTVVLLKGSPYEMGYARGALLKKELHEWAKECIYMIKRIGLGEVGMGLAMSRSKEIAAHIPIEYKEELIGLSAGSGIDYKTLVMLNSLDTIGKQFACTSVAVRKNNGHMIRSRSLDYKDLEYLKPSILQIYQPDRGIAFASVNSTGSIGVYTAINEKGLTFGSHDISGSISSWEGIPSGLMYRAVVQNASTVNEAEEQLKQYKRCVSQMAMVSDTNKAVIFEFNSKRLERIEMKDNDIVLTNYTRELKIGGLSENSVLRYDEARSYLNKVKTGMTEEKLVDLNRQKHISKLHNQVWLNIHSAIFNSNTLDFWVATESPTASRGKWVGFNLGNELYQKGKGPEFELIPAMN